MGRLGGWDSSGRDEAVWIGGWGGRERVSLRLGGETRPPLAQLPFKKTPPKKKDEHMTMVVNIEVSEPTWQGLESWIGGFRGGGFSENWSEHMFCQKVSQPNFNPTQSLAAIAAKISVG